MRFRFAPFIAFLCAILALVSILRYNPVDGKVRKLRSGMDFSHIRSLSHEKFAITEYPAVLFFFATWCGSCKVGHYMLADLVEKHHDIKLYAISISDQISDIQNKIKVSQYEDVGIITEIGAYNLGIYKIPTILYFKDQDDIYYADSVSALEDFIAPH